MTDTTKMELLAPAGDFACLRAALEAGADAVYLGVTSLNARRRARNFSAVELAQACELAHGMGRRVYLTLNIDLAQSELLEAAKVLEIARRCKVDAVLVRDPALLAFLPLFPELEFHASTQACIACSADVEAARELGFRRVVLARELSLPENRGSLQARRGDGGLRPGRPVLQRFRPVPSRQLGRGPQREPRPVHQPVPCPLDG
ncbi:MAG: peptidase U32 family protein [Myxococcales bacterium]